MELLKAPLRNKEAGRIPWCWKEQGWEKGTFFLAVWRLFFLQTCCFSEYYVFLLGRLWVKKWIWVFFVCFGFLFVLEVELRQKQAVMRTKCSVTFLLWSNSCSKWIMRHTCILVLVECKALPCTKASEWQLGFSVGLKVEWVFLPPYPMSANASC